MRKYIHNCNIGKKIFFTALPGSLVEKPWESRSACIKYSNISTSNIKFKETNLFAFSVNICYFSTLYS